MFDQEAESVRKELRKTYSQRPTPRDLLPPAMPRLPKFPQLLKIAAQSWELNIQNINMQRTFQIQSLNEDFLLPVTPTNWRLVSQS